MQNKKMTNPTDGINETNKKLRSIYEQICCISAILPPLPNYDILKLYSLTSGDTQSFGAATVHSIAWELGSGATLTIDNGSTAVTYTSSGSITFSTLNLYAMDFTAVGGTVRLIVTTNND